MNKNIEEHNKKFYVGAVIQGAEILKILKYSKNGKSTQFLYKCPKCGKPFIGNARITKVKTCSFCDEQGINAKSNNKTLEYFINDKVKPKDKIVCENIGQRKICGIYGVFVGNCVYIGESLNIAKRWSHHIEQLETGKHHNFLLQNFYDKNRTLNFKVLDSIETSEFIKDNYYKTKLKTLNLVKESEYINLFANNGEKRILNIENTIFIVSENKKIKDMIDLIKQNNITEYDQILELGNENILEWPLFKKELKIINNKNYQILS